MSRRSPMSRPRPARRAGAVPTSRKLRALGFAPKMPLARRIARGCRMVSRASRSRRGGASERLDMSTSETHSRPILECQICASKTMRSLLFLGYVPPVNTMPAVGARAVEELTFPLEMFRCEECGLAQIGLEVSPEVLFPYSYPYLSGTTKILRENFADLYREASQKLGLQDERSRRRHRLERRLAADQFQGGRSSRARDRPVARRRGRASTRHRDAGRLFRRDARAQGQGGARSGEGRHGRERVRAYRRRPRRHRRHLRTARGRRRLHLRVALSARSHRYAAIRHDLSRAPALLRARLARGPAQAPRPRGVPRQAHPDPRRLDPRLFGPRGNARDRSVGGGTARHGARGRNHRRQRNGRVSRAGGAIEARALCADRGSCGSRAPASTASARPRAHRRSSTMSGSTTTSSMR